MAGRSSVDEKGVYERPERNHRSSSLFGVKPRCCAKTATGTPVGMDVEGMPPTPPANDVGLFVRPSTHRCGTVTHILVYHTLPGREKLFVPSAMTDFYRYSCGFLALLRFVGQGYKPRFYLLLLFGRRLEGNEEFNVFTIHGVEVYSGPRFL